LKHSANLACSIRLNMSGFSIFHIKESSYVSV